MAEVVDYSAFGGSVAAIVEATKSGKQLDCGWIPPHLRTAAMNKVAARIEAAMPKFSIRGRFAADKRRYPLWMAGKVLTGKFLKYNWQQTGSCVGAGGDNAHKTRLAVEIVLSGDLQKFNHSFWPWAYGRSRYHGGIRGEGEGSFGSAWAEAVTTDGIIEDDGSGGDFPDFQERDGWLVLPSSVEMKYSNGAKFEGLVTKGRVSIVKTMARMRSKDDCFEAIVNGYPLTQASSFGFRGTKVLGTKHPIRVAEWNGTWHHQTYVDEVFDHPELSGIYFRWGNNWGPDAHGAVTMDEPPGGVYIHEKLMDRLCKEGEVYAMSGLEGFVAQDVDFYQAF